MAKRYVLFSVLAALLCSSPTAWMSAQEQDQRPSIRVDVDLVQLNVAVTDSKGRYVTGLRPSDFGIAEDGISQKLATFGEGNEATRRLGDIGPRDGQPGVAEPNSTCAPNQSQGLAAAMQGANVYILFDKSNYMYRGFVFA